MSGVLRCATAATIMQAAHHPASTAVDSDSDDADDFDQLGDLDAFDTDEVQVSPDDEQALAAFMVSCTSSAVLSCGFPSSITICCANVMIYKPWSPRRTES